jgi:hypothetical protein
MPDLNVALLATRVAQNLEAVHFNATQADRALQDIEKLVVRLEGVVSTLNVRTSQMRDKAERAKEILETQGDLLEALDLVIRIEGQAADTLQLLTERKPA